MEKWLRMTVDATLFCNGATPEQKYHAVVADPAHRCMFHAWCLKDLRVCEGSTRAPWDCVGRRCREIVWFASVLGAVRGRGHPLSRFPRNSCEVGNRLQDS